MDFLPHAIEEYASRYSQEEPETLKKLNRDTNAHVLMPRMLSGHMQGRILSMFSHMIKPLQVLEIGTYTGYSAICLAEGVQAGGMVHTIDNNEELAGMIRTYIADSGHSEKITFHLGEALKIIPGIPGQLDLVFIDADKENYSNYYNLVFPRVRVGGWIIADNVLWSGKVIEDSDKKDKDTLALMEYASMVKKDARVVPLLLPVRDGLLICRKIKE